VTKFWLLFRLSLRNLLGYPLRSFLTTLGVIFGVGAVIAMMAMTTGAEQKLLAEIGRLGIDNVILNSVKPAEKKKQTAGQEQSWYSRHGLTYKDERQIRETVPNIRAVLPVHKRPQNVWWGSRKVRATVYAVRPSHLALFGLTVTRGRNLTDIDGKDMKRVCVIRAGLLKSLGNYRDPLGASIQVGEAYYRVVGVLPEEEFRGYAQEALAIDEKTTEIYVPYGTMKKRFGTLVVDRSEGSRKAEDVQLSQMVISIVNVDDVLTTAAMLQRVLEANHEDEDYKMVVPLEVLQQRRNTQKVMNYALISVAAISLLVGGIGIANIMLATVTERTKEIGIRRALGAKRRHIVLQFLAETTTMSGVGGLLGVASGFAFTEVLNALVGWDGVISGQSIGLAFGISVAVGIVSGILPARRAALLDPIAALRHE
jgi:putative ABC transport system permease protein